jgi:Flp pilus assembly pilin Flp
MRITRAKYPPTVTIALPLGVFVCALGRYDPAMKQTLLTLLSDETGQDLIEYTLLMAFVALASATLFMSVGTSIAGIWATTNSQLTAANTQAS